MAATISFLLILSNYSRSTVLFSPKKKAPLKAPSYLLSDFEENFTSKNATLLNGFWDSQKMKINW